MEVRSPVRDVEAASGCTRREFLRLAAIGAAATASPTLLGGMAWGGQGKNRETGFAPGRSLVDCPDGDHASYTALSADRAGMFLLFSDVHFDPFADPSKVKALAAAPAGEWRGILAGSGRVLSPYGRDTDDALFQSFLDDMAGHAPKPDFLLFPGDLLCHRFWTLYPKLTGDSTPEGLLAFIGKTAEYFLSEVTRRFPDVPLYLALGNNDSFEGDFRIAPKSPYLSVTAPIVARLALKEDPARAGFLESYPQYGCYAAPLPVKGANLVVLNDMFWARRYSTGDFGAPVMDFLKRELASAQRSGEKVWLMSHVPLGDNSKADAKKFLKTGRDVYSLLLTDAWNSALAGLMVQYSDTVVASFAGHVHRDEFRLVYPRGGSLPAASMRLAPSISPVTGNNPGYQIYSYDRQSLELLDVDVRYVDLGATSPAWDEEYRYSRAYGRGLRAPQDWQQMYQDLLTCPDRRKTFGEAFDLRSRHIHEVNGKTFPIFRDALALSTDTPGP